MEYNERKKIIAILFSLGAAILLVNLFHIQIIDKRYRSQAQNSTLTKRSISPPRGIIYDRNDQLVVINEPTYGLDIIYNEVSEDFDLDLFCSLLNLTKSEYESLLNEAKSKTYYRPSIPISLVNNISPQEYSVFQEHLHKFPGFYPTIKNKRAYPFPNGAHVLGYISEVNNQDIEQSDGAYSIGDFIGASGIERVYDNSLRGEKGLEYLLKDNIGREVDAFQNGELDTMAVPGKDLISTLDIELQAYGELLMQNKKGSIVAIEPETGEILTMVSSPTYDPNKLAIGKQRNSTYFGLVTDTLNKPLFNRALKAKYPPGSIFKPVLSLIALQEGITHPTRSMRCFGRYAVNERRGIYQGCRNHPSPKDMQTALQHSCNSYYFQLIREFLDQFGFRQPEKGLDLLNSYLDRFGLGRRLGIDLFNEGTGFIPTPLFYENLYPNDNWRSTYVLSLGIGQGELELTTVQMANLAAIIANRGYYIVPHVLKFSSQSNLSNSYEEKIEVKVDQEHFEPVIEGMELVISRGTGWRAAVRDIAVCGKTGTSQNPHGEDHSVFFGFAPKDDPKIAIAVYVENAGGGGAIAAPVGGLMIEKYLNTGIQEYRLPLQNSISDYDLINNP